MTPKQQGVLVVSAPTTVSYSRNPAAQVKQRFITEGVCIPVELKLVYVCSANGFPDCCVISEHII